MDATQIQSLTDNQVVTFHLGHEVYGLPLRAVEAIIAWAPLTHLPRTPNFIAGILAVRNSVLPVMDLRTRLEIEASTPTSAHRILILQLEGVRFGAIVNGVKSVEMLPEDCVERDIPMTASLADVLIEGVARLETGLIILLKPEGLLTKKELEGVDKLAQQAEKTPVVPAQQKVKEAAPALAH